MAASKRKVAVIFGYNGSEFFGSQIQSGAVRTAEKELEEGFFRAGMITEANHNNLHKIGWSRASRTDRGVHAKSTVICAKLELPREANNSLVERINSHLPRDLRVFALKDVTSSFNAHGKVNYREYEYLFPVKCILPEGGSFTAELSEEIRRLTSKFIGTKNYHNFTRKLSFDKAESNRYIVKFEPAADLLTHETTVFLRFLITGQSFLYHQIRSMVGAVLAVLMKKWTAEEIDEAFKEEKKRVPIAPAEGLFLSQVLYTTYNRKQPQKSVSLTSLEEAAVDAFFQSGIFPNIAGSLSAFESWSPDQDSQSAGEEEPQDAEDSR